MYGDDYSHGELRERRRPTVGLAEGRRVYARRLWSSGMVIRYSLVLLISDSGERASENPGTMEGLVIDDEVGLFEYIHTVRVGYVKTVSVQVS